MANFKQGWLQTQKLFARWQAMVKWRFNNACVLCHYPTEQAKYLICNTCWQDLERFELGCDVLLHNPSLAAKLSCQSLSGLAVVAEYQWPFTQFIPSLKFYQGSIHAKWFGQLLQQQLSHQLWPRIDIVIAMPLHPLRQFRRGYNQAYLIAAQISDHRSRLSTRCLTRVKMTKAQSKLNRRQRLSNVKQAFQASSEVAGKTLLLVDDVITTGQTLEQAAKELLKQGATAVYGAAVAIRTVV